MTETLELPNGDVVTPETVFLFNEYPYRFVPLNDDTYAFKLVPLYWGESGMDVPFRDREALAGQWGPDSRGVLTDEEWAEWLREARDDERFGEPELDAIARELPVDATAGGGPESSSGGVLAMLRSALGF